MRSIDPLKRICAACGCRAGLHNIARPHKCLVDGCSCEGYVPKRQLRQADPLRFKPSVVEGWHRDVYVRPTYAQIEQMREHLIAKGVIQPV